jgi:hypothetical protein
MSREGHRITTTYSSTTASMISGSSVCRRRRAELDRALRRRSGRMTIGRDQLVGAPFAADPLIDVIADFEAESFPGHGLWLAITTPTSNTIRASNTDCLWIMVGQPNRRVERAGPARSAETAT